MYCHYCRDYTHRHMICQSGSIYIIKYKEIYNDTLLGNNDGYIYILYCKVLPIYEMLIIMLLLLLLREDEFVLFIK